MLCTGTNKLATPFGSAPGCAKLFVLILMLHMFEDNFHGFDSIIYNLLLLKV